MQALVYHGPGQKKLDDRVKPVVHRPTAGRGTPVRLCFRHLLRRRLVAPDLAAAGRRPGVTRAAIGSVHPWVSQSSGEKK